MNEEDVRAIVKEEVGKALGGSNGFSNISFHSHNGVDSQQLDPNTALSGFLIRTATPVDAALTGKLVLSNIAGTRRIWVRIAGAWYSVVVA